MCNCLKYWLGKDIQMEHFVVCNYKLLLYNLSWYNFKLLYILKDDKLDNSR